MGSPEDIHVGLLPGAQRSLQVKPGSLAGGAQGLCRGAQLVLSCLLSHFPRAHVANIWTQCYGNSRPKSSEGLKLSMCLIVTIGASTGSGR